LERDVAQATFDCSFQSGELGFAWNNKTLQVTSLEAGGQALFLGVQVGWSVKKLDGVAVSQVPQCLAHDQVISFVRGKADDQAAEKGKLLMLNQQKTAYKYIAELLIQNETALALNDLDTEEPSEKECREKDQFYEHASALLKEIAVSFDDAMVANPRLCARVFARFKGIFENHTMACGAAALSGGAAGYAYGLHLLGPINLHLSHVIPAIYSNVFGIKLAVATGLSGLGAVVVVAVAIAAVEYAAYIYKDFQSTARDDEIKARKELNAAIKKLRDNPLPIDQLTQLRELFDRAWSTPLKEPKADDECIICHEGFTLDDALNHDKCCDTPVRAPGCRRAHFLHDKCLKVWTNKSSSLACLGCDPLPAN